MQTLVPLECQYIGNSGAPGWRVIRAGRCRHGYFARLLESVVWIEPRPNADRLNLGFIRAAKLESPLGAWMTMSRVIEAKLRDLTTRDQIYWPARYQQPQKPARPWNADRKSIVTGYVQQQPCAIPCATHGRREEEVLPFWTCCLVSETRTGIHRG